MLKVMRIFSTNDTDKLPALPITNFPITCTMNKLVATCKLQGHVIVDMITY